jgi:hypothetical protein
LFLIILRLHLKHYTTLCYSLQDNILIYLFLSNNYLKVLVAHGLFDYLKTGYPLSAMRWSLNGGVIQQVSDEKLFFANFSFTDCLLSFDRPAPGKAGLSFCFTPGSSPGFLASVPFLQIFQLLKFKIL